VDVSAVAQGHIAAAEKGRSGERYILGGENLTLKQLLDKLATVTGLPSPTLRVPHGVAMAFAVVDTLWSGYVTGREPRASVDSVRMSHKKMFVSSARAERELGWKIVPVENALRRAVEWYRTHGYAAA
jgi:dihydroflavonol-4-reductase